MVMHFEERNRSRINIYSITRVWYGAESVQGIQFMVTNFPRQILKPPLRVVFLPTPSSRNNP